LWDEAGAAVRDRGHKVFKIDLKDGNSYALDLVLVHQVNQCMLSLWSRYVTEVTDSTGLHASFGDQFQCDQHELREYQAFDALGWDFPHGKSNLRRLVDLSISGMIAKIMTVVCKSESKTLAEALVVDLALEPFEPWMKALAQSSKAYGEWLRADQQKNARAGDPYCLETFTGTWTPLAQANSQRTVYAVKTALLLAARDPKYLATLKKRYNEIQGGTCLCESYS